MTTETIMTTEQKAKAYDEALKWMRKVYPTLTGADKENAEHYFPELKESEDERIRKAILSALRGGIDTEKYLEKHGTNYGEVEAWLEKQKENIEKEYVFRPLGGTNITTAANQAVRRANKGDRLVMAFNGAYIPVRKGCDTSKIVDVYNAFIEKQKEQPQEELVYQLNGLMQEYVKEGKDDAEKEHRFKCYRLFWDVLEDADFFEQKEPDGTWTEEDDAKIRVMCEEGDLKPSEIAWLKELKNRIVQKEQKPSIKSINIDQLKSMMLQYLQEATNEKDDSAIEADTDKWARKILLGYDFEHKPVEGEWPYIDTADTLEGEILNIWQKLAGSSNSLTTTKDGFREIILHFKNYIKDEQKPAEWSEEDEEHRQNCLKVIKMKLDEKPYPYYEDYLWLKSLKDRWNFHKSNTNSTSEWSDEDEEMFDEALTGVLLAKNRMNDTGCIGLAKRFEKAYKWLESFRPRLHLKPGEELILYKEMCRGIEHSLAIGFMNYLDNNKPEGKMCLSNLECEDIENAFKENDWAKIIRYVEKYQIQSEKKPEVKMKWWVARDSCNEDDYGLVAYKNKPFRDSISWIDDYGSDIITLPWDAFPDLKWEDNPVEVEVTIRKK